MSSKLPVSAVPGMKQHTVESESHSSSIIMITNGNARHRVLVTSDSPERHRQMHHRVIVEVGHSYDEGERNPSNMVTSQPLIQTFGAQNFLLDTPVPLAD